MASQFFLITAAMLATYVTVNVTLRLYDWHMRYKRSWLDTQRTIQQIQASSMRAEIEVDRIINNMRNYN